jgi:hypothetical protein
MLFGVQDDDSAAKPDLISDIYFSLCPADTCHTFHAKPDYAVPRWAMFVVSGLPAGGTAVTLSALSSFSPSWGF